MQVDIGVRVRVKSQGPDIEYLNVRITIKYCNYPGTRAAESLDKFQKDAKNSKFISTCLPFNEVLR